MEAEENLVEQKPKQKNERMHNFTFVFLFVVLVLADQLTKLFAKNIFRNQNFAFSLPLPIWLMYVIYFLVLAGITAYVKKNSGSLSLRQSLAWVCIFAGALSNVIERMSLGYVRDWVYIWTGVFNLADGFIILGILILMFGQHSAKS